MKHECIYTLQSLQHVVLGGSFRLLLDVMAQSHAAVGPDMPQGFEWLATVSGDCR